MLSSRVVVVVVAAQVAGCAVPQADDAPTSTPSAEAPARYWLRNAELLDGAEGNPIRRIGGPVEVEVFRDGRVRSLPDARDRFEGYLRQDVSRRPQRDRGLALFAQREAELRFARPDGPVVGKVHRGALVSVRPAEGERVAIGGLAWGDWMGFVAQDGLGAKRTSASPLGPSGPGHALVTYLRLDVLSVGRKKEVSAQFARCHPIWFPAEGEPSQRIDGVELIGRVDVDPRQSPPRHHQSTTVCVANVIVEHDGRLLRVRSDGSEVETDAVPPDFVAVAPPQDDPLLRAIARDQSVFWLRYEPPAHVSCAEARFEGAVRRTRNHLIGAVARMRELAGERQPYDAAYGYRNRSGQRGKPLVRSLTLEPRGQGSWGFDAEYVVLATDGDALLLVALPVREAAVAFDPREAERWFVSRDACEGARDEALRTLQRDPRSMPALGFHVEIPRPP